MLLDGVDLRTIRFASLRRSVVLVPQEGFLFDDTLARQRPLRPARGHRGRRPAQRRRARPRRLARGPAARARHRRRSARRVAVGRGAPARRAAPRLPRRPRPARPRRGHQRGRPEHRGAHPARARLADPRPHLDRHRAPALDRRGRRRGRSSSTRAASSSGGRTPSWSGWAASTRGCTSRGSPSSRPSDAHPFGPNAAFGAESRVLSVARDRTRRSTGRRLRGGVTQARSGQNVRVTEHRPGARPDDPRPADRRAAQARRARPRRRRRPAARHGRGAHGRLDGRRGAAPHPDRGAGDLLVAQPAGVLAQGRHERPRRSGSRGSASTATATPCSSASTRSARPATPATARASTPACFPQPSARPSPPTQGLTDRPDVRGPDRRA